MSATRWARLVGLTLVALQVAGCAYYLDRKDTVSFGAGDAVQTNMWGHVRDPWSRYSRVTRIEHDGERIRHAIERYRAGPTRPSGQRGMTIVPEVNGSTNTTPSPPAGNSGSGY